MGVAHSELLIIAMNITGEYYIPDLGILHEGGNKHMKYDNSQEICDVVAAHVHSTKFMQLQYGVVRVI